MMGAFTREQADLATRGEVSGVIEVGATLFDAELLTPSEPRQILAALDTLAHR